METLLPCVRFHKCLFAFLLLLLPVYWYALNYEDYHQWSARREMVVEVTKKIRCLLHSLSYLQDIILLYVAESLDEMNLYHPYQLKHEISRDVQCLH